MKVSYLDGSFLATSILGFLISVWFITPNLSLKWGFTLTLFFILMFIASIISVTHAEPEVTGIDKRVLRKLRKMQKDE